MPGQAGSGLFLVALQKTGYGATIRLRNGNQDGKRAQAVSLRCRRVAGGRRRGLCHRSARSVASAAAAATDGGNRRSGAAASRPHHRGRAGGRRSRDPRHADPGRGRAGCNRSRIRHCPRRARWLHGHCRSRGAAFAGRGADRTPRSGGNAGRARWRFCRHSRRTARARRLSDRSEVDVRGWQRRRQFRSDRHCFRSRDARRASPGARRRAGQRFAPDHRSGSRTGCFRRGDGRGRAGRGTGCCR